MDRRSFLHTTALAAGALALSSCDNSKKESPAGQNANQSKKFRWRLQIAVPKNLPVWGDCVVDFARKVNTLSNGRLEITVYGAGELVPPSELFNKVMDGTLEMGHSASYYWSGKVPGADLFTTMPFGLNASGMNCWIYYGGGLQLWEELYAPYNIIPIPSGTTCVQMGGWFNKEIKTIDDFKGLKMRIPGLGGKVITKAGASAEMIPQSEIYTSLATGRIDATEWVGPYHDYIMEFYKVAKYYYVGGWHEPGSMIELIINKDAFAKLPADLQETVRVCATETNKRILDLWTYKDMEYLHKMKTEGIVQFREFPQEVVHQLRIYAKEAISEMAKVNETAKKAYESISQFQEKFEAYLEVSERAYDRALQA